MTKRKLDKSPKAVEARRVARLAKRKIWPGSIQARQAEDLLRPEGPRSKNSGPKKGMPEGFGRPGSKQGRSGFRARRDEAKAVLEEQGHVPPSGDSSKGKKGIPTGVVEPVAPEDLEEFERRLEEARKNQVEIPVKMIDGKEIVWAPQEGSQASFMSCPLFEVLYHGTRGPGKTDGLIMAFGQHVGRGHGAAWCGIIFRQTYPQLADVQAKSEKWFRLIFPDAEFNRANMYWSWPTGERLYFRHMARHEDYWNYHGHEYPFIGFEELTNWADDGCFTSMFSCCRSSNPNVPRMIRATTNPYGPGHNWVKHRFRLSGAWWKTIVILDSTDAEGELEPARCAIHGHLSENKILMAADPDYRKTIRASATNEAMAEAWLNGSWDYVAGGMFDDVWDPVKNVMPDFHIPSSWRLDRSFDWGSSKPFSVGWWAVSDGSDLVLKDGRKVVTVRGDLFRVDEWYGWTGKPDEGVRMLAVDIAKGIVEREMMWDLHDGRKSRVRAGPADSAIYTVENGVCIANDMQSPVRIGGNMFKGVQWTPADKRPGSRKMGWEMMRKMIRDASPPEHGGPREKPGLFVREGHCEQFLRTVLSLPRNPKDLDDILDTSEDHVADEVRYRIRSVGTNITGGTTTGMQ